MAKKRFKGQAFRRTKSPIKMILISFLKSVINHLLEIWASDKPIYTQFNVTRHCGIYIFLFMFVALFCLCIWYYVTYPFYSSECMSMKSTKEHLTLITVKQAWWVCQGQQTENTYRVIFLSLSHSFRQRENCSHQIFLKQFGNTWIY